MDLLREKKMIGRMAVEAEYQGPHLREDFEAYWEAADSGSKKGKKKNNNSDSPSPGGGWKFNIDLEFVRQLMEHQKNQKILAKK